MRGFLSFLLDCLIPRSCLACGRGIGSFDPVAVSSATRMTPRMEEFLDSGLRTELFAGISVSADVLCPGCWSKLELARGEGRLAGRSAGAMDVPLVSPFHTSDELLALVRFLKFSGGRSVVPPLGWWMAAALGDYLGKAAERDSFDCVLVPVPLHPTREKSRGYNQAALLAREVAGRLGLDVDSRILKRTRNTKAQSTLDRKKRSENVCGAFGLGRGEYAAGKNVILMDDLVTTGETAQACIAALESASPRSIAVLAAGRARD
ncbi:MAG: phosphoribosyltransferase family protein [Candidatus Krumholzibacteria bacterium]|nr:phosphoribosyltransferase family protein [Candidatus Krumholzibacteria bacterium]